MKFLRAHRTGCIFTFIAVIAVIVVSGAGLFLYARAQLEPLSASGTTVAFAVSPGEGVDQVTQDLNTKHLIKSNTWFGLYAGLRGLDGHLRPGIFNLSSAMGASEIINVLEGNPAIETHKLVVTEGMRATDIASAVAALNIGVTSQQYLTEVNSGKFNESFLSMRPPGASLEGFLFPDTYEIPGGSTAHDIVEVQLQDFAAKAEPLLAGSHSPYDTLTIASIVEREAKFAVDRPQVAAVIDNRLAVGKNLEVDATVIYGLNINSLSLTQQELATDTPYNSYIHSGLPPTPISNPGLDSITAALHPAAVQYVYYVSDGCGHIHYSVTAADHQSQVNQYVGTPCS
jgi:UPF0755 protein